MKESGDTARLHKKFEKKLSALVSPVTHLEMYDSMQGTNLITTLFSVYRVVSNKNTVYHHPCSPRGYCKNRLIEQIMLDKNTSLFLFFISSTGLLQYHKWNCKITALIFIQELLV